MGYVKLDGRTLENHLPWKATNYTLAEEKTNMNTALAFSFTKTT